MTAAEGVAHRAVRFFWCMLALSAGASVAGNITHALLAQPQHAVIAAAAAVVPPAVLLGSTHGVSLLVRVRGDGRAYWTALVITALLALCAFVLSFDSLRTLADNWGGYHSWTAWLWPVTIDLSIANSTIALLALTGTPSRTPVAPVRHNGAEMHHTSAPLSQLVDEMIGAGVTRLDRERLTAVLAELDEGTAPSTIARNIGTSYATVSRIAEAYRG